MINITQNRNLYLRGQRLQIDRFEMNMYKGFIPILESIWNKTAELIVHGDVLNIVPSIVKKYSQKLRDIIYKNYRNIGVFNFKQVTDRIQEIRPKRIENYYFKDSIYNFWFYFDLWSKQQAVRKVTLIDKTTTDILKNIINQGVKNNMSYGDIAKQIKTLAPFTKSRSMMIAVTETHTAFNKSIYNSIESTNVKMDTKEWMNAGDERVRVEPYDHMAAGGETVSMDDYFINTGGDLMYPGDEDGDPANIIYCRCLELFHTDNGI